MRESLLLGLLHWLGALALAENACLPRRSVNLYGAANRALRHSVYARPAAGSAALCARECLLDSPRCRSFNYQARLGGQCELSNAMRADGGEDLTESPGDTYFDTDAGTPLFTLQVRPASCKQLLALGHRASGVYTIYPKGNWAAATAGLRVSCDMDTDGGGWLVFQRRHNGSVDFYRGWAEYRAGFGSPAGEFWLGNDNLAGLTSAALGQTWELRVDLEDWNGQLAWAAYEDFSISSAASGSTLNFGRFDPSSSAGDSLSRSHRGSPFTTYDNNNDYWPYGNCAIKYESGFWFNNCWGAHLNGRYHHGKAFYEVQRGMEWPTFHRWYSLKSCSMKFREMN